MLKVFNSEMLNRRQRFPRALLAGLLCAVGLGIAYGMLACISVSLMHHSGYELAASLIYGISNILLYTMSSIYHGLPQGTAKKVFQVLDHCTIYIMLPGSPK